jgi:hypothetical protein
MHFCLRCGRHSPHLGLLQLESVKQYYNLYILDVERIMITAYMYLGRGKLSGAVSS